MQARKEASNFQEKYHACKETISVRSKKFPYGKGFLKERIEIEDKAAKISHE